MANIIFWLEVQYTVANANDATKFDVHGQVMGDEGSGQSHPFEAIGLNTGDTAATINAAIRDAAIATFEADEAPATVGVNDKKTFIGGGVVL